MKSRMWWLAASVLALVALSGLAWAEFGEGGGHGGGPCGGMGGGPGDGPGPGMCGRGPGMLPDLGEMLVSLNLTESQWLGIRTILLEELPPLKELQQKAQEGRQDMREQRQGGEALTDEQVEKLFDQRMEQRKQIVLTHHRIMSRINELLTPEQQQKWQELRQERQERGGEFREMRKERHHEKDRD